MIDFLFWYFAIGLTSYLALISYSVFVEDINVKNVNIVRSVIYLLAWPVILPIIVWELYR